MTVEIAGHGWFDLEGWRLDRLDDGAHVVELRLGRGYDLYALATRDDGAGAWVLMVVDSAVRHVEVEVVARGVTWSCAPTEPLPADGSPLDVFRPGIGMTRIGAARVRAQRSPFAFRLELDLATGHGLVLTDTHRWRLLDGRGGVVATDVTIHASLSV